MSNVGILEIWSSLADELEYDARLEEITQKTQNADDQIPLLLNKLRGFSKCGTELLPEYRIGRTTEQIEASQKQYEDAKSEMREHVNFVLDQLALNAEFRKGPLETYGTTLARLTKFEATDEQLGKLQREYNLKAGEDELSKFIHPELP